MEIRPLGNKILIRIIEEPETEVGGIIVPGAGRKAHREAVVVAVGPNYRGSLVPGNTVYHSPFTGIERHINGEPFVFVKEFELLGVVE